MADVYVITVETKGEAGAQLVADRSAGLPVAYFDTRVALDALDHAMHLHGGRARFAPIVRDEPPPTVQAWESSEKVARLVRLECR